jgi:hypothetical protein
MRSAFATFMGLRKRSGALIGLVSALMFIGLALHVGNCRLSTDHHTIQQTSRIADRALAAQTSHTASGLFAAADGNGNQHAIIAQQVFVPSAFQVAVESDAAPSVVEAGRNTALAHRKLTVLLI